MRSMFVSAIVASVVVGCLPKNSVQEEQPPKHLGSLGEDCLPDGRCLGEELVCTQRTAYVSDGFVCKVPPRPQGTSKPESVLFCESCREKCGERAMLCEYTDTSVWGSKPARCECK